MSARRRTGLLVGGVLLGVGIWGVIANCQMALKNTLLPGLLPFWEFVWVFTDIAAIGLVLGLVGVATSSWQRKKGSES